MVENVVRDAHRSNVCAPVHVVRDGNDIVVSLLDSAKLYIPEMVVSAGKDRDVNPVAVHLLKF